jgi:hypothetical protein
VTHCIRQGTSAECALIARTRLSVVRSGRL